MQTPTNVPQFIEELNAGVLEQKLAACLTETAGSVVAHGGTGEVSLTLKFTRLGEGTQLKCAAKLGYKKQKARGSISEDDTSTTPFYVNEDGTVTMFPASQIDMLEQARKREDA